MIKLDFPIQLTSNTIDNPNTKTSNSINESIIKLAKSSNLITKANFEKSISQVSSHPTHYSHIVIRRDCLITVKVVLVFIAITHIMRMRNRSN